LSRPYKYLFVEAVGTIAAPTNQFVRAAGNKSRPYKYMIYRDPCVEAAGQTAPTNGLQPHLKMLFDIVPGHDVMHQPSRWWLIGWT